MAAMMINEITHRWRAYSSRGWYSYTKRRASDINSEEAVKSYGNPPQPLLGSGILKQLKAYR